MSSVSPDGDPGRCRLATNRSTSQAMVFSRASPDRWAGNDTTMRPPTHRASDVLRRRALTRISTSGQPGGVASAAVRVRCRCRVQGYRRRCTFGGLRCGCCSTASGGGSTKPLLLVRWGDRGRGGGLERVVVVEEAMWSSCRVGRTHGAILARACDHGGRIPLDLAQSDRRGL